MKKTVKIEAGTHGFLCQIKYRHNLTTISEAIDYLIKELDEQKRQNYIRESRHGNK